MDQRTVAETFRMIIAGDDIAAPASMLKNVSEAKAAARLPGFPYSMLENLWHTVFWQEIWLDKVEGRKPEHWIEDWQSPDPSEWKRLRAAFMKNQDRALAICTAKPFRHKMKNKDVALRNLMNIAVHDAYHIGQINLIKRVQRKTKA